MTQKWNYLPITSEQLEASQLLAKELGISPILGRLLVERGITTVSQARKFFRPQLPELHDPFLMKDMDKAVDRLNIAMGRKERILIYGDYDVDGTTAVALVYRFLQQSQILQCRTICSRMIMCETVDTDTLILRKLSTRNLTGQVGIAECCILTMCIQQN